MKYQTDVIDEQKVLRRGRQDVLTLYFQTILLIIFLTYLEYQVFP